MSLIELFLKAEHHLRPRLSFLPPSLFTKLYSNGRNKFLQILYSLENNPYYLPPDTLSRTIWGIHFQQPLFNAAGMFKYGEGYEFVASQGAGAYLAGTSTSRKRTGNFKNGIRTPFTAYPLSKTASNWLGLPNNSHKGIIQNLQKIQKIKGCPIGLSISASPELDPSLAIEELLDGLFRIHDSQIDFIELNESCPNVEGHSNSNEVLDSQLLLRLKSISDRFLSKRNRQLPVIVKFSNDTSLHQVPELVSTLVILGFDGVNFGNTSTQYQKHRIEIHPSEITRYDYFTTTFGGGLSGNILKLSSFDLSTIAVKHLKTLSLKNEFHIIRTGGIDSFFDISFENETSPSLYQWYTGYFNNLSLYGMNLYKKFYERLPTIIQK